MTIQQKLWILVLAVSCSATAPSRSFAQTSRHPFQFKDGDRVVLLGATYIERAQRYGWLETELQLATSAKISIRNLGWSADTVWAESRGIFDAPAKGYARMIKQVLDLKPTVILLHYGNNEAFAGSQGLDPFLTQYRRLIKDLALSKAAIVLLSPIPQFKMPAPLPDPSDANRLKKSYSDAIQELAAELDLTFVDLWEPHMLLAKPDADISVISSNGVHFNDKGYQLSAKIFAAKLLNTHPSELPQKHKSRLAAQNIEKNRMYFHRWRPQNVTYLFLFRKHEQGNNAKEVAEFEPFVRKLDEKIAALKTQLRSQ